WRAEDDGGRTVTVVLGQRGIAGDTPLAQGDSAGEVVAVYDGAPGTSLAARLAEGRPVDDARALARDLCAALAAAHARGTTHGDLHPGRVLVGPPLRIVGFGLIGRGDPAYQAPEVLLGEAAGRAADVYAAAAIVYALHAGRPPFAGRTAA